MPWYRTDLEDKEESEYKSILSKVYGRKLYSSTKEHILSATQSVYFGLVSLVKLAI